MTTILLTALYLLATPLVVMHLAKRWKWINSISPMTVLYAIGLILANTASLPETVRQACNDIGSVAIPLAIPLMLMGCNLKRWSTGNAVKVFLSGLTAVIIISAAGYFIFRGDSNTEQFAQVSAVSVGIYTGGIPNMGAIAQGVGMDNETYLYLTSYDLIATGLYLLFIIFFGKPIYRKLLKQPAVITPATTTVPTEGSQPEKSTTRKTIKESAISLCATIAIAGIAYMLAGIGGDETNMTVLILSLTTLSIAYALLFPKQSNNGQAFSIGTYFVYVFSLSISSTCNFVEMDLGGSLSILGYVCFVIFGSVVLQILFSRILGIDSDSTLVASVALINSPPFVPMAATVLGNKEVVMLGISIGLLGYMFGNYIGIGLFYLLS